MSCENCLKDNEQQFELDGDFLCYWCKEDLELWENNIKTYTGPKNTSFEVGKFYGHYLTNLWKREKYDDNYYEYIKRTKHYIHFKAINQHNIVFNNYETIKKKLNIDIWNNEYVVIDRKRLDAYNFENEIHI
jgi:hypothetical protein